MQSSSLGAPLTYVRMVLKQHATKEFKRIFKYRKRIRMPSKERIC